MLLCFPGAKSKKNKEKKGKSKTILPEETDEVASRKETKTDNKRKQEKKKSGRIAKTSATSEEKTDKDFKSSLLTSGISKLQADISEKKLSPEQLMEIEKQRTKDMYILPLVDAVDSR